MSFLGDIGSLYMLVLIALLIVGFGMIAKGFIDYLLIREKKSTGKSKGADNVKSVNWLKLSLYSLAGIIVSLLMLSFISSTGLGVNESSVNHSTTLSGTSSLGTSSHSSSGINSAGNTTNTISLKNNLDYNNYQLQDQLSQMQYQINQLQLMIQNMNSSQLATTP